MLNALLGCLCPVPAPQGKAVFCEAAARVYSMSTVMLPQQRQQCFSAARVLLEFGSVPRMCVLSCDRQIQHLQGRKTRGKQRYKDYTAITYLWVRSPLLGGERLGEDTSGSRIDREIPNTQDSILFTPEQEVRGEILKAKSFRTIFWVSVREKYEIAGSTGGNLSPLWT